MTETAKSFRKMSETAKKSCYKIMFNNDVRRHTVIPTTFRELQADASTTFDLKKKSIQFAYHDGDGLHKTTHFPVQLLKLYLH